MHEHQKTHADYYDLKRKSKKRENRTGIIVALVFLAMYITVSTIEYQDCLKGAISC